MQTGPGGDRPTRPTPARVLTELGLTDVTIAARRTSPGCSATWRWRRSCPPWSTPACRCSASRSQQPSLEDVFVAPDRGGLRCQRLRCLATVAAPVRERHRGPALAALPALRAGDHLRPAAQPRRARRAGRGADHHRHRGPGVLADGDAAGGPDFISGITGNGLFVAFAALTVELPLFLPLAVATIAGDSVAGEANIGTLRYLLTIPAGRTRLLVGQVRRHRDLRPGRHAAGRAWSARSWAWRCSAAAT